MSSLRPLTKIFGGKAYLKDWIISNFPVGYEDMAYSEFFIGAGSVYLNKKPSRYELINDSDAKLINIWRAVQTKVIWFQQELLHEYPYQESIFNSALKQEFPEPFNEYVLRRMSRSGMRTHFSWSERLRGGRPGDENGFLSAVAQLPLISKRLNSPFAIICNENALEILKAYCDGRTGYFTYLDPPYLHATRVSKKAYAEHEMSDKQHEEMAAILNDNNFKGKVLLSGYDSPQYRQWFKGWNLKVRDIANHSSQSKTKQRRIECLWSNY